MSNPPNFNHLTKMNTKRQKSRRKKYSLKWLWNASIIPEVIPQVIFFGFFSLVIILIHQSGVNFALPSLSLVVPAVVLGLLLVFRTNTAYARFWEARKLWGSQIAVTRHLAQSISILIPTVNEHRDGEKLKVIQLLIAFAFATKLHLRAEPINGELNEIIRNEVEEIVTTAKDYLSYQSLVR